MGLWQTIKDYATGDDRTEYKDAEEFAPFRDNEQYDSLRKLGVSKGTIAKIASTTALTYDPDEQTDIYYQNLKDVKGIKFGKDKYNNPMIKVGDTKYYVNKPGFSTADAESIGVDALAAGVSALFPELGYSKGIITKLLGKTVGYGGYEEAKKMTTNKASGEELINPEDLVQSGLEGVTGGVLDIGGSFLGSLVGKGIKGLKSLKKPVEIPAEELSTYPSFIQEAYNRGGNDRELANHFIKLSKVDPKDEEAIAKLHPFLQDAVRNGEVPFTLTKGQITGDVSQLANENAIKKTNISEKAKDLMEAHSRIQQDAVNDGLVNINKKYNNNADLSTNNLVNSGEGLIRVFKNLKDTAKNELREAYSKVNLDNVGIKDPNTFNKIIEDNKEPRLIANKLGIYDNYNDVLGKLREELPKVKTLGDYDNIRQSFNDIINDTKSSNKVINKTSDPALQGFIKIKDALDNHIDNLAENGGLSGEIDNLQALKEARALNRKYYELFDINKNIKNKGAEDLLQSLTDDNLTGEGLVDKLLKPSANDSTKTIGAIRRIKEISGVDVETNQELSKLKEQFLLRLFTKNSDDIGQLTVDPKFAIDNYNNYFKKNTSVTNELFNNQEKQDIENYITKLNKIKKGNSVTAVKPKGNMFDTVNHIVNKIPLSSHLGIVNLLNYVRTPVEYSKALESLGLNKVSLKQTNPKIYRGLKAIQRLGNLSTQQFLSAKR